MGNSAYKLPAPLQVSRIFHLKIQVCPENLGNQRKEEPKPLRTSTGKADLEDRYVPYGSAKAEWQWPGLET